MIKSNLIIIFTFLSCILWGYSESRKQQNPMQKLTDDCLKCICVASSECDEQVLCHTVGPIEYYCGPYQVSRTYWNQAGSPGRNPSDPFDFEECVNNIYCAIETVRGYMKKRIRDCNHDGRISCGDFALVHKAGPKDCHHSWVRKTKFWRDYTTCSVSLHLK